jgi:class 3 adenylate cyclase
LAHQGPFDKTVFALGAIWLLCLGLSLHSSIARVGYPSLILSAAAEPDGYPRIVGWVPDSGAEVAGIALGDRLLTAGDTELRGLGHVALYAPFARAGREIQVRYERDGVGRDATLFVSSYRMFWPRLPASLVFALAAVLLMLRAPRSKMVRAFAQALMAAACFLACTFGGGRAVTLFAFAVHVASVSLVIPLSLRAALLFPDGDPPRSILGRLGPWAFAALGLFEASRFYEFPFERAVGMAAMTAGDLIFFALLLGVVTRAYRRADPVGRRQIRWVLLGVYLAVALPIATTLAAATDLSSFPVLVISMATLALIPVSIVIAIARYNLFDIDRLITSTASYTLLGILLLAGILAAAPRLAQLLSAPTGIEPAAAQLALSLVLAGLLIPCHRWLGPRVERAFFPERHALVQGMDALLGELASCENPRDLAQLAGERLEALLRPESCAIYARDGEGFSPIVVHGRVVPPVFQASSPLVTVLEARGVVLSAEGLSGKRRGLELSPFDRAALETLGVPVVIPVRLERDLAAVICLGSKRSGDVYTSSDLALLTALADKLSTELLRFDQTLMVRQARGMQETLRRYVPGALVDELSSGRDLEEGEREVSVLFVDIRGYASYAEDRSPTEIFSTVNRYTRCVSEVVRKHGGSVVEFNGDGMMTLFGAPRAMSQKERAAMKAGLEILGAVGALPMDGGGRIEVGVGIATGDAFVGNIRAADRLIWSAIGNTTNLAARLQEMTREFDAAMVIDASTWGRAGDVASGFQKHAAALIRGRRETEEVYALPLAAAV